MSEVVQWYGLEAYLDNGVQLRNGDRHMRGGKKKRKQTVPGTQFDHDTTLDVDVSGNGDGMAAVDVNDDGAVVRYIIAYMRSKGAPQLVVGVARGVGIDVAVNRKNVRDLVKDMPLSKREAVVAKIGGEMWHRQDQA